MSDLLNDALARLVAGEHIDRDTAAAAMRAMMSGDVTPVRIAAFLTAMRAKGETPEEVAGFVDAMRSAALRVPGDHGDLIDTCGTGGDRSDTFNISTAAAFVAAGAGLKVAKHGNRSATSKSGGADVLEALGVRIDLPPDGAAACLDEAGIAFLFAPLYHPAVKHVAPVRRELPFPTVFNVLGPLCNPASPAAQVLGVFRPDLQDLVAGALARLDSPRRALVVHGHGGLDEISLSGPTRVLSVDGGDIASFQIEPAALGLAPAPREALAGGDAAHNAQIVRDILAGTAPAPHSDVVMLNAAAALWVGGLAPDLATGLAQAEKALRSGAARAKLADLVRISTTFA
ncbi:MAG: anthranilate phosphoribosyltransferase [Candidatus Sericytochromatia bacterium]|nr:anthranilate phosphoribosyltransferase [Candidatus Tanganyikabacteria bacterium]